MKQTVFITMFLFMFACAFSQQGGNITSKEFAPKSGVENVYVYQPPKGLLIPEKAVASIVYINKNGTIIKRFRLFKRGVIMNFHLKHPILQKL